MDLKVISAGAGSGKTYTLTNKMAALLKPNGDGKAAVRASGIIATTFTNKAAAELRERVRVKLLEDGLTEEADELGNALIGTVHAIGVQLLQRFAFEAGVSPNVDIIADTEHQALFNQSLSTVLSIELIEEMNGLSQRLGFFKNEYRKRDWRSEVRTLVDIARSNNFDTQNLLDSKAYSITSYLELLPAVSEHSAEYFNQKIKELVEQTIQNIENNEDTTKKTKKYVARLRNLKNHLHNYGSLDWDQWAKLAKNDAAKKSREAAEELVEFATSHEQHPNFQADIKRYVSLVFDTAIQAIEEYQGYKQMRGLIDYTDMEVMILQLLENETVLEVLKNEIDLLLVDEFQDTNPIQLKIFLQLSDIAKQAIWVGDPKQSIYGFRGAAPELMEAVIKEASDIETLPNSWRSREDLVNLGNAIFVEAFDDLPEERIALTPPNKFAKKNESKALTIATHHWHFNTEGNRRIPNNSFARYIARSVAETLQKEWQVRIKNSNETRPMLPSDVAILCRSNKSCQQLAEALHAEGLQASIARNGLLQTAEASLLMACMRFIMNKHDALSVAEIQLLASQKEIESILKDRIAYLSRIKELAAAQNGQKILKWGADNEYIQLLNSIRKQSKELSAAEILNWLIERLDICRIVTHWSRSEQRLANVDAFRKLALEYEESCNRLHTAATLGGFLLWLDNLANEEGDEQGSSEGQNAVRVMTYHKSKGLEWPMVVCDSLSGKLRDNLWGFRIVHLADEIDIKAPLANRLICYWVYPYGKLKKTKLQETINNHPAKQQAEQDALAEEARLLYVGITRARDYLVLPKGKKRTMDWLRRVYHHGDDSKEVISPVSGQFAFDWKGEELPLEYKTFNYEKNLSSPTPKEESVRYFLPKGGNKRFDAAQVEFSKLLNDNDKLTIGKTHKYASPLRLDEENQDYLVVQKVLKTFALSDNRQQENDLRERKAAEMLQRHALEDWIAAKDLLHASSAFFSYLENEFDVVSWKAFYHFRNRQNNFLLEGTVDLVAQTNNEQAVLVQSLHQQVDSLTKQKRRLLEDVGLLLSASKLQPTSPVISLLWQPIEGKLIEYSIERLNKQGHLF